MDGDQQKELFVGRSHGSRNIDTGSVPDRSDGRVLLRKGWMKMDYKKEIVTRINSISGRYSSYEVFTDWVKCCSLSIDNYTTLFHDFAWHKKEQEYLNLVKKYENDEIKIFSDMLGMLCLALEKKMEDVLGWIYMASRMGSKAAGQFFTPYHLSELCANLTIPDPQEDGKIYLYEPSCGGGGMIIASVAALKNKGFDYQNNLEVIAQDLDWKGVHMCYLQLRLLGVKAVCVQGDTMQEPYTRGYAKERMLYTPAKKGLITWMSEVN